MAELRITFTLREPDLKYLRGIMRKAAAAAAGHSEEEIVEAALKIADQVRISKPPDYVLERVETLETTSHMLMDPEYALPSSVRRRVRTGLAYFANPADLIPDQIPVLGFLDDAIMMDLVGRELRDEIQGYRDFQRFRSRISRRPARSEKPSRADRLEQKRKQIRARIQAKRGQERRESAGHRRFRLW